MSVSLFFQCISLYFVGGFVPFFLPLPCPLFGGLEGGGGFGAIRFPYSTAFSPKTVGLSLDILCCFHNYETWLTDGQYES